MAKLRISAVIVGLAMTAAFASPAFAIENAEQCESEGGTMVNVKNSDYCLVPIREEAYRGEEYDGNQLGVSDCPGDTLNDGIWCMYPVTVREEPKVEEVEAPAPTGEEVMDKAETKAEDMAKDVTDAAKEEVEKATEE